MVANASKQGRNAKPKHSLVNGLKLKETTTIPTTHHAGAGDEARTFNLWWHCCFARRSAGNSKSSSLVFWSGESGTPMFGGLSFLGGWGEEALWSQRGLSRSIFPSIYLYIYFACTDRRRSNDVL